MGKSVRPLDDFSGVKAQNIEWFATDIKINDTGKIRMNVVVNSAVDVEITKDSGGVWIDLNSGNNLGIDDETNFSIPVRAGDLFNVRTTNASGTTVRYCRLDFITNEG